MPRVKCPVCEHGCCLCDWSILEEATGYRGGIEFCYLLAAELAFLWALLAVPHGGPAIFEPLSLAGKCGLAQNCSTMSVFSSGVSPHQKHSFSPLDRHLIADCPAPCHTSCPLLAYYRTPFPKLLCGQGSPCDILWQKRSTWESVGVSALFPAFPHLEQGAWGWQHTDTASRRTDWRAPPHDMTLHDWNLYLGTSCHLRKKIPHPLF